VEALVQLDVVDERVDPTVGVVHHGLHLLLALAHPAEQPAPDAALRGQPRGGALEHAAQLDRVVDVTAREGAHAVAAAFTRREQPFVLEARERQPQRRARHAEPLDERELGHALAGRELAVEDQLAQREQRRRGLAATVHRAAATISSISRRAHIAPPSMLRL
jgi:hypothetical protein